MKRAIAAIAAVFMGLASFLSCTAAKPLPYQPPEKPSASPEAAADRPRADFMAGKSYTFNTCAPKLPDSWNPHTLSDECAERIYSLISSPLVYAQPTDIENGDYVWVFGMAESIRDVTAEHRDDIVKYSANTGGKKVSEISEGYVYEIKLRTDAKWDNGESIGADDYIWSLKALLDPARNNANAAAYIASQAAAAGSRKYSERNSEIAFVSADSPDRSSDQSAESDSTVLHSIGEDGVEFVYPRWFSIGNNTGNKAPGTEAAEGTPNVWGSLQSASDIDGDYVRYKTKLTGYPFGKIRFEDTVGCYKVDENTFNYVCAAPVSYDDFMAACQNSWLVYKPYYGADYCTDVQNTMSFGPYKLERCEPGKQVVLQRNSKWYGWKRNDDGSPIAYTEQLVNGERLEIFKTTKIVFKAMSDADASRAFADGELTEWHPSYSELLELPLSDMTYTAESPATDCVVINTDSEDLRRMDSSRGNKNSVVLSNINFRRALSLALDRDEWCGSFGGTPCLGIISDACLYDRNDAGSSYRYSWQAMESVCDLYEVKYRRGADIKDIKNAYESISGYSPEKARKLFTLAAEELIAEGLYSKSENVRIRVACSQETLSAEDAERISMLNRFVNEAAEGTPFGEIVFEGIGLVEKGAAAVTGGEYAMGIASCGGDALKPFESMSRLCQKDVPGLIEVESRSVDTANVAFDINGSTHSMGLDEWVLSMTGMGHFALTDNDTKLSVLAALERWILERYCLIPLSTRHTTVEFSEKAQFITREHSPVFGWGGFDMLVYNYADDEWEEYISSKVVPNE